jgi:putative oxidoreductase
MLTSIKTLYQRALQLCAKLNWIGPLAIRLVVGLGFVVTGWGKLNDLDTPTELFTNLHIPFPHANAVFVSLVEFICGILVTLGLGTRIAALFLIGVMTVAIFTARLGQADGVIDFLTTLPATIELTYLVTFVWMVLGGAGPISIDHLLTRREATGHGATGHDALPQATAKPRQAR